MTSSAAEDDAGHGAGGSADGTLTWVVHVESFDAFYAREYSSLVAMAFALTGSRAHAEDVAQEAMIAAYRRWEDVSRLDLPVAWVRRVRANTATSLVRHRVVEARALLRLRARPVVATGAGRDGRCVLDGGTSPAPTSGSVRACATSTAAR